MVRATKAGARGVTSARPGALCRQIGRLGRRPSSLERGRYAVKSHGATSRNRYGKYSLNGSRHNGRGVWRPRSVDRNRAFNRKQSGRRRRELHRENRGSRGHVVGNRHGRRRRVDRDLNSRRVGIGPRSVNRLELQQIIANRRWVERESWLRKYRRLLRADKALCIHEFNVVEIPADVIE